MENFRNHPRNYRKLAVTIVSAAAFAATLLMGGMSSAEAAASPSTFKPGDGIIHFTAGATRVPQAATVGAVPAAVAVQTWYLTGTHTYTLFGTTVMQHIAQVTFSCGPKLTTPRSLGHAGHTAPGFTIQSAGDNWNYYTTSLGQSNHNMTFLFGIPTPWGGVGSTYISNMKANLHANCSSSWTYN